MAAAPPAKRKKESHGGASTSSNEPVKDVAWLHPKTEERASATIEGLYGFNWRVESYFHLVDNRACFSVKVTNRKNDESSLWHCQALMNVYLLHNDPGKTIEKIDLMRFTPGRSSSTTYLAYQDDLWADDGFLLRDGSFLVSVKISVLSVRGETFLKNPHTNWAEEVTGSDMCLIVEGEPFYVGKYNLVRHSHYFEILFGRDFSEAGKTQIELKEISRDEFRLFLDFIHNMGVEMDIGTVWSLLEMGRYFNAPAVMSAAEEYLTSTENEFALDETFVLADQFHLPTSLDWCVQQLTTFARCQQVRHSARWDALSPETQGLIDEVNNRLAPPPPPPPAPLYPMLANIVQQPPFVLQNQQYYPQQQHAQWAAAINQQPQNNNYGGGAYGSAMFQPYQQQLPAPLPQYAQVAPAQFPTAQVGAPIQRAPRQRKPKNPLRVVTNQQSSSSS